jgi:class 3 adenylate cyclase/tetratricopeptide (TPR) repeat protein
VPICASCGRESEGDFAFCPYCGAVLGSVPSAPEQRKTVTVLFCDVTGSTALAESTDPEAVRALLARYFERMKGIVESHGGTVEKFIGDAVMAVFGVPRVREDDALRGVRAACEMRDALPELGVRARIGVNTGEVVTGTEERLATGDAVNVAARLEQAASPGDVLLGEATFTLVREAVDVEAVEPLELKGKGKPVPAYRLVSVHEAPERGHETLFVGRAGELETLRQAWQQICEEQRCELVTVVGDAGVGKSRLTAEFLSSVDARSVGGRCIPYGEGITYWPVVEVIKQLDALPSDPAAAASLRSLLGETEQATSAEEIAWAFRKLLEQQAPLVCVFDDIQWGEQTFLDLVEHLALLSTAAPILVLCLARPELPERRAEWPVALRLEPLPQADVDELIPETFTDDLREKIIRASGGNPLFVTQMVAMAAASEGEVVVPPTLQAVLAARLDQLESVERSVLERGAVEGEVFHRGAVQALSDGSQVTPRLASLVRKNLIRPDRAQLPGDDAFRFRHLLIRDAAYGALSKATRARLHERFSAWLEERGGDLVELDEILGYHLEQAARYRAELGQPDPELAERAGARLADAGRRALWRGDYRTAAPLLERALELARPLRLDVRLELDLADAQPVPRERAAIAERAAERAREAGDRVGEALALVVAAQARLQFADDPTVDELERLARAALPLLEDAEDHAGLARVWDALGNGVANFRARFEERTQASEQALRHLRLAGWHRSGLAALPAGLLFGPRPADEALRTLDSVLPENPGPGALLARARLLAMLARFDEAWALARPAAERARELGGFLPGNLSRGDGDLGEIAALAGDHATAAAHLRRECDRYQRGGDRASLSTLAPQLGRSLCALGCHDEAEPLAQLGRELGGDQDLVTQMLWRQVQARVHAHRGQHAEAERLAREAEAMAERTDALNHQGDALCDLAEVLAAAGRTDEAAAALEQAIDRYERKKNLATLAQVRRQLEALRGAAPA